MKQQRYIPLFIIVISISFIPFIGIYSLMSGNEEDMVRRLLINLPVCFVIGLSDYLLIKKMATAPIHSNSIRLVIDLIATTSTCVFIICILNHLLADFSLQELIRSALPAIPWNWVVTLLIELFFYNTRQHEIEKEKANYQLAALRNQINPHFLFNSLNALASLAYTDAEKANLFAKRLSAVYRYLLTNNEALTVDINEELKFVDKYLYLEQIRFGEALNVNIRDTRDTKRGHIIPASIQMLVENAIKHNICTTATPLEIDITISDRHVTVSNNLNPRQNTGISGTGLRNIRRQYALRNKKISVMQSASRYEVSLPVID